MISSYQRICCFDAETAIEVDEIGAAAQQHVLAVIDYFAGARQFVRRSAATEIGTPLEEFDAIACVGQSALAADKPASPPPMTATVPRCG